MRRSPRPLSPSKFRAKTAAAQKHVYQWQPQSKRPKGSIMSPPPPKPLSTTLETKPNYPKTSALPIPRTFKLAGIFVVLAVGLIHLIAAPDHLEEAPYIGVLFLANFAGAIVAGVGLYQNRLWGWWLGALVAGGAFVMFIVSRLVALPGYDEHVGMWIGDSLGDYLGIPSLLVEASFVALFVVLVGRRYGRHNHALSTEHEPDIGLHKKEVTDQERSKTS